MKALGRILALDLGEKRIGLAISDETRTLARPLTVLKRRSRQEDFNRLAGIIQEQKISLLLVGLPLSLTEDGISLEQESPKVVWMRDYARALAQEVRLEVQFCDESYSTWDAAALLRVGGKRTKQQKPIIDAAAAALFLQGYLDGHR